jgi:asparagine synthase (glutamine-hydrolysing)
MCGICGQYHFQSGAVASKSIVEAMTRTLIHRGPDDEGYFFEGSLGLGFRRLSIIDLAGGHQPMSDREKTVWIVFNGEIYNFPELRRELEGYGHVFQTNSDTEVILHGYKQWDLDVFNHLNGMFGLALWDSARRRLVLSRDPMGIKMVYYTVEKGTLLFGSEIRPMLAAVTGPPDVDPVAVNLFLRYRYTPSPLTLYQGIHKLAPGTMLVCEKETCRVERWYRFEPHPFSPAKTDDEAAEELLDIYKRSVKRQLISDVPVGLLLSGGIDSGMLLGLMHLFGNSWPTYTVGYGKDFAEDEIDDAAETARIFSARNVPIELDRATYETHLPMVVSSLVEPVATSSTVLMHFICRRARQDVKVALIGQGPDELFGGYPRHMGVHYGALWRKLPGPVQQPLMRLVHALPRNETLKRGVQSLHVADRMKRYQSVFSILPGDRIDALFRDGLIPPGAGDRVLEFWSDLAGLMSGADELGGLQFLEIRSSLPDELLMFGDKMSMAHGLEVRVPYLDREIVEYVERLPARMKVRGGTGKWLHRRVCRNFLPETILRRKKRAFAVNVTDEWFRDSVGRKMGDYLLDPGSRMYRFLRPETVHALFVKHAEGREDHHKILYSLVVFEEWLRGQPSRGQRMEAFS